MIKRRSDVVLEITAYDPDTIDHDLNAAVEIARDEAMKGGPHGILVTQRGYTNYTVAISRDVPLLTDPRMARIADRPARAAKG